MSAVNNIVRKVLKSDNVSVDKFKKFLFKFITLYSFFMYQLLLIKKIDMRFFITWYKIMGQKKYEILYFFNIYKYLNYTTFV